MSNSAGVGDFNTLVKFFEIIIFVRMLKLLTLLYEVQTMRILIETIKNLISPLSNFLIIIMAIFYLFGLIGQFMFGGKIRTDSPALLHNSGVPDNFSLMNFNDTGASNITLFSLIIVNNWYVIVDLCVSIKGGDIYYRYYFMIFYYFGVIIGLNILIAFSIDMSSSVERLDTD